MIRVISHGPSCLDGVMAAAVIARFYRGSRVITTLATNGDSDRTIQGLRLKGGANEEVWITDLSWNSTATAQHLATLSRAGARLYWIDHHRSAVSRPAAPEFKVPFSGKVLSERFSAARLTFNFLKRRAASMLSPAAREDFASFFPFVAIADDYDRWVGKIPGSAKWALAVQTLGGAASYREILKLDKPVMTRRLRAAYETGTAQLSRSVDLARSTLVDTALANGLTLRTGCCYGYSSEVAANLYDDQTQTVIALVDLRSQGVSLRRSPDCKVDLSELARSFGGGGHAAASGFAVPEITRAPAEKLARLLAGRLAR